MVLEQLSKEAYISNPCRTSALPYWKAITTNLPDSMLVIHKEECNNVDLSAYEAQLFFKLVHNLKKIDHVMLSQEFYMKTVNKDYEIKTVVNLINRCYTDISVDRKQIMKLQQEESYDKDLWVFIFDRSNNMPVALGIAQIDSHIKEGSFEWVQVLPGYRRLGLGTAIVNELLTRLQSKASFATVSGQVKNLWKPEVLYKKCGFTGDDIWYVLRKK